MAARPLLAALLGTVLLSTTALMAAWAGGVRVVTVTSGSMEPTLPTGARALVVPGHRPALGDVVLFSPPASWREGYRAWRPALAETPDEDLDLMVKRIVGMPGDTVVCCNADGSLERNGVRIDEPWLAVQPSVANTRTFRVTVPPDHVWLMGDNRPSSFDSRAAHARDRSGFVPMTALRGRVTLP